jgi:hypothetical protein
MTDENKEDLKRSDENQEELMKVVIVIYNVFQEHKIDPDVALSAMIYMIGATVQQLAKKPREMLCCIAQDFLNLSQAVEKDKTQPKED